MGNRIVRFVKLRLKENYDANRALPADEPGCDGRFRAGIEPDRDSVKQRSRLVDHGTAVWFWWFLHFAADVQMDGVKIRWWGSDRTASQ